MIRFYITPFLDSGDFGSEVEVTPDVDLSSIGKIKRTLDNSEYDIGVFRYNSLSLKLHNWHGKYSDVENLRSMFRYNRSGSKVRVTWAPAEPAICGVLVCGESILSEEVDIYLGILNDESTAMDADNQIIDFQVLSFDSIFAKVEVPFSELDGSDTLADILFKTLNQSLVTKYMDVAADDIDLDVDYIPDDLSWFENKTGKELIAKVLLLANSVIYLIGDRIYAKGRTPAESVSKSFYGQASDLGNENVYGISEFRNGQNRIINFARWDESAVVSRANDSIERWGVRPIDLDAEFVTDAGKQALSSDSIVAEFEDPKRELTLDTPIAPDVVALQFLDRVDIDYPTVVEVSGKNLPKIGITEIGDIESPLPYLLWDFQLRQEQNFKIMGIEFDLKKEMASLSLREI